jgi:hypothetical protein
VNAADIREFVARQREPVQREKLEYWAERAGDRPRVSALEAGHQLFEHARAVLPDFPNARYLADDFNHHLRLKSLLDRASEALSFRRAPR